MEQILRKIKKQIVAILHLERKKTNLYKSQWGDIELKVVGDYLWIELREQRLIIKIEDREDLKLYLEETLKEIIPCDISKNGIQYKIF